LSVKHIFHARTKHVKINYHFIRDRIATKAIQTHFISFNDQFADILAKLLSTTVLLLLASGWTSTLNLKGTYYSILCIIDLYIFMKNLLFLCFNVYLNYFTLPFIYIYIYIYIYRRCWLTNRLSLIIFSTCNEFMHSKLFFKKILYLLNLLIEIGFYLNNLSPVIDYLFLILYIIFVSFIYFI